MSRAEAQRAALRAASADERGLGRHVAKSVNTATWRRVPLAEARRADPSANAGDLLPNGLPRYANGTLDYDGIPTIVTR